MNDLSNRVLIEKRSRFSVRPIPPLAIFVLVLLFFVGLSVSVFILIAVRNASFFVSFIFLTSLVVSFIIWNARNFTTKASIFRFISSLPETDLRQAKDGQLVKITGNVKERPNVADLRIVQ